MPSGVVNESVQFRSQRECDPLLPCQRTQPIYRPDFSFYSPCSEIYLWNDDVRTYWIQRATLSLLLKVQKLKRSVINN